MRGLRHPSNGATKHRPASEGDAHPRTGTLHALQGLLAGPGLSLQAQSSRRAADNEDFGERSTVNVVAGGTVITSLDEG